MPNRVALLSDVHGNAAAFQQVIEDIHSRDIGYVINMGDIIGYGPEPERCIDLSMLHCDECLCGNHEYAVMNSAEGFNSVARSAMEFVRERLRPVEDDPDQMRCQRWDFIGALKRYTRIFDCMVMHGSPRHHIMEYVLPSDPKTDPLKLDDIFECMDCRVAFVGHTHFPGIIVEGGEEFILTTSVEEKFTIPEDRKVIVNVGSVGQPRDRDVRSCYVEFDGTDIWFRRVKYDVEETVRKIQECGRLHTSLGQRLREGK